MTAPCEGRVKGVQESLGIWNFTLTAIGYHSTLTGKDKMQSNLHFIKIFSVQIRFWKTREGKII